MICRHILAPAHQFTDRNFDWFNDARDTWDWLHHLAEDQGRIEGLGTARLKMWDACPDKWRDYMTEHYPYPTEASQ